MADSFVKATVITIGDELMVGQVIDTNSAWIAEALNTLGIWLHRRVAIGDNRNEILKTLKEEAENTDVIIITGGLGPTADDITKPVLNEYFGGSMVLNQEVLDHLKKLFEMVLKRPFTERNAQQAMIPERCTVLMNHYGTAPGMQFERDNCIYFSLPGVPYEMQGLMRDYVLPLLKKRFPAYTILHRTLVTAGIGESYLADHIQEFEAGLDPSCSIAYLPGNGVLRLRLTAKGKDAVALTSRLDNDFARLTSLVKEWLISDEDLSLPQLLLRMLRHSGKTFGTVESCTGGYLAHQITTEAGSSAVFMGSVISYSNEIKINALGVKPETLEQAGAVSEETVLEMAAGGLKSLKCDYIIATSGIMGPDGGTGTKPVGTVWIATGNREKLRAKRFHFRYNRMQNIRLASNTAFNELRKFILEEES